MVERTFGMVKPHAKVFGMLILQYIESNDLEVVNFKRHTLTREEALELYDEHKEKPFFEDLVRCATEGPALVMIIEGENAVKKYRDIMGSTYNSEPNTIRGMFREEPEASPDWRFHNAVHGADSPESAKREIAIFFKE